MVYQCCLPGWENLYVILLIWCVAQARGLLVFPCWARHYHPQDHGHAFSQALEWVLVSQTATACLQPNAPSVFEVGGPSCCVPESGVAEDPPRGVVSQGTA